MSIAGYQWLKTEDIRSHMGSGLGDIKRLQSGEVHRERKDLHCSEALESR